MKNREKFIFSVVLLLLHILGATGALTTTLKLEWGQVLKPQLFLTGLLLLGVLSVLFWTPCRWKRLFLRGGILFVGYAFVLFLFRRGFLNSLAWAMSSAVERLNGRYEIHMIWNWSLGGDASRMPVQATWSVLAVLVPYLLLLSYGVMREHMLAVILADGVWFVAACGMDSFPGYGWLVLCIVSIGGQLLLRSYRDDVRAGMQAAVLGLAVLGGVMLAVYFFLLPGMDQGYEQMLKARLELHQRVNEEWIPRIQAVFSPLGLGHSPDVTGSLGRQGGTVLTFQDTYRVTLSSRPKSSIYLRGFVGAEYAGDQWKASKDSELTGYYQEQGWEMPESGRELVNLTYGALRSPKETVWVEELAGAGRYSLYPYGSELGGDYRVHWDGTADRKGSLSQYSYRAPDGRRTGQLSEKQTEEERRYRRYVYDRFCDYPAERLPELTAFLEQAKFRTGNVYDSLADVYVFLRSQAVYELEAADPPPGKDFVEHFLFETREGYCAHFASAAVLMLRYLGVPARYATGYSLSAGAFTKDGDGNYTAVATDMQAHAWAEVYLDGIGWIPMEMTPGAAAFTSDDSMRLLELAGQLSGAFEQGSRMPVPTESKRPENTPKAEGSDRAEKPDEPQEAPQLPKQDRNKVQEAERSPSAGGAHTAEDTPSGENRKKIERPERGGFALPAGVKLLLWTVLAAGGLLALAAGAASGMERLRRRRFERAGNRERIFLLHRNLRRLLRLAGHEERLSAPDEETQTFRRILEKSGFGEKEPSAAEVHRAAVFCCGTAREEYEGLFLWKKPLFRWMDACSRETMKRMEIF